VKEALDSLAGQVSLADMRRLNRAVDAERQDPAAVVREFLAGRRRAQ
jgi:glycine betaine/choline ABC-type transport system substrate-binding protein